MDSLLEIVRLFWFLAFECLFFARNRSNLLFLLDLPDSPDFRLLLSRISLTLGVDIMDELVDILAVDCLDSTFELEGD